MNGGREGFAVEWGKIEGKRVLIGDVGVDSAHVSIGDIDVDSKVNTPHGDGTYAIYAQLLNGRPVLVIDFGAIIEYTDDRRMVLREQPSKDWKCPICGSDEHSGGYSPTESSFECSNGHVEEVQHAVIEGLD